MEDLDCFRAIARRWVLDDLGLANKGEDMVARENEIAIQEQAFGYGFSGSVYSRTVLGIKIPQEAAFFRDTDREMVAAQKLVLRKRQPGKLRRSPDHKRAVNDGMADGLVALAPEEDWRRGQRFRIGQETGDILELGREVRVRGRHSGQGLAGLPQFPQGWRRGFGWLFSHGSLKFGCWAECPWLFLIERASLSSR